MADTKTEGVMTALKGRKGFAPKKGVSLLGIVEKLTKKRAAAKDETPEHENAESKSKEKSEGKGE